MGIVRLAKCLRTLESIDEITSREQDIKNKISGNRIYMDFVSIVYKIQDKVINELNYLLYSFMLIQKKLLHSTELVSNKFIQLLKQYTHTLSSHDKIISIITDYNTKKTDYQDTIISLSLIITDEFMEIYRTHVEQTLNQYIYENIIFFIVDMLTQKIVNVEHVIIAFDGIPSFGKVQEQRHRRYMRYAFLEFRKTIDAQIMNTKLEKLRPLELARYEYDINHFYVNIKAAIDFVYEMYHQGKLQKDIIDGMTIYKIIPTVEVIDEPYGEGEKILMDRLIQDYQIFNDDKTYVFYSPDGDSVILCLYIYIKTKSKFLNVVKSYSLQPTDKHNESNQYVNIVTLYNNIIKIVEKYSNMKFDLDDNKDNICTDFIFLINMYGNDFLHQIPTLDISATILDIIYIYSKFISTNDFLITKTHTDNKKLVYKYKMNINYNSLKLFFKEIASFEHFITLDTYLANTENANKLYKIFGNIFTCKYVIDYRDIVKQNKKQLHDIINANNDKDIVERELKNIINKLNLIVTITNKRYGDIFTKLEVKNINAYVIMIINDPSILLDSEPRIIHILRQKRKKNEKDIKHFITTNENDMIKNNYPIDINKILNSNKKDNSKYSFDYYNIRLLVPHNQMPTTVSDIDVYMLEWKSGKWTDILNAYTYNIGYDSKKNQTTDFNEDMKKYQYNMLHISSSKDMDNLVIDYLRTLSWLVDYYMNTNYTKNNKMISTWSYLHERSPFISHIHNYLEKTKTGNIKYLMKNVYKNSMVTLSEYLGSKIHKLYIYPQTEDIIKNIPKKYQISFPNIYKYVEDTITMTNSSRGNIDKYDKKNRVFDCRLCPYFSKCLFKNNMLSFRELLSLQGKL